MNTPKQNDMHEVHFFISKTIWDIFKSIYPEYGMTTIILRRLIINHIKEKQEEKLHAD